MKCNKCNNANVCLDHVEIPSLSGCTSGIPDRKVPTNADKIRNMSDKELVELITGLTTMHRLITAVGIPVIPVILHGTL